MKSIKVSFLIALLVAFIDFMGLGLVYPLFSSMLFDQDVHFLPPSTPDEVRGIWLGVLIALLPLFQFFSAPIWGAISDAKGRKKPLQVSLAIACGAYVIAFAGVAFKSIILLFLSRAALGLASGNLSIVQAAIADISSPQEKTKNYGLYGMALGSGFTLGPFLGGVLSSWGYGVPFVFASVLVFLNFVFAVFFFKETSVLRSVRELSWNMGLMQLKKAFAFKGIRTILVASFLHNFGWSYFFEFAPVYLISRFSVSSGELGVFYGVAGAFYAVSAGVLIRPFLGRYQPQFLFFAGNLLAALSIFLIPLISAPVWIIPLLLMVCFFVAFVSPTSTALVSNYASAEIQGEALGVLSAVNSAALMLSPLFSGSVVGSYPPSPMMIGGSIMLVASAILLISFRKRLIG